MDIKSKKITVVDKAKLSNITDYDWSPDSQWLIYTKEASNGLDAIWVYSLKENKKYQLTDNNFNNFSGVFSKDGKYIIAGVLFDRKTGENLTAEREKEINKIDINKIPLKDALHIKFGKGGRKLILVADPECPYCRMAFNYLKNKNVDLYIFFMPLCCWP